FLDEHDRFPHRSGAGRQIEAAGTCADDAEIGLEEFHHAAPLTRSAQERSGAAALRRANTRRASTGASASRPSATSAATSVGVITLAGSKSIGQSRPPAARQARYEAACAAITLSRPAPNSASARLPGVRPSAVAATNVRSRTLSTAAMILVNQAGTGTRRRNST